MWAVGAVGVLEERSGQWRGRVGAVRAVGAVGAVGAGGGDWSCWGSNRTLFSLLFSSER